MDNESENSTTSKEESKGSSHITTVPTVDNGEVIGDKKTKWESFLDSFQRKEEEVINDNTDLEAQDEKASKKKPGLSARHVALIAMAGGLGTGLLVGNGRALALGGPGGLLIAYAIVGSMLFATMQAAGELAVAYSSLTGGFNAYAAKLVDPSLGFAVAWNYAVNWFTVLPLEMVTAAMTIKFWNTEINPDVFVAIFLVLSL